MGDSKPISISSGFNDPKEKMDTIMEEERDTGGPSKG